ncbi:MAG: ABC transporter ATP-binding protein [Myxococcaceae bacterium]
MGALIDLRNITRTYKMGDVEVRALRGVSIAIEQGDFVAIMGSSGSGKSTMMNTIGCLDRPNSGEYLLDGRNISHASKEELAEIRNQTLGFVFQSFNLLTRTSAIENVELPMLYGGLPTKERESRAKAALEKVGLGGRLDHHPNQLSGGQQQRVAIARAIVTRPRCILADEPTGNLDSRTSIEVMALFQELNTTSGITVVLVTHEPDIAAYASRVIVMKDGQVLTDKRQEPMAAIVPPLPVEGEEAHP